MTTRSLDNTADSLQQAALNHSIDQQFFLRQLSQSSLNFLESDLNVWTHFWLYLTKFSVRRTNALNSLAPTVQLTFLAADE